MPKAACKPEWSTDQIMDELRNQMAEPSGGLHAKAAGGSEDMEEMHEVMLGSIISRVKSGKDDIIEIDHLE